MQFTGTGLFGRYLKLSRFWLSFRVARRSTIALLAPSIPAKNALSRPALIMVTSTITNDRIIIAPRAPMIAPEFDGNRLGFQVSHRRAHPRRTLSDLR